MAVRTVSVTSAGILIHQSHATLSAGDIPHGARLTVRQHTESLLRSPDLDFQTVIVSLHNREKAVGLYLTS